DALHRETYYSTRWASGSNGETETTWERLLKDKGSESKMADWLLTPTLPNRFFTVVPQHEGAKLAQSAAAAIQEELGCISEAVWKWLADNGAKKEWKDRWKTQIRAFPQTAWATQSWLDRKTCLDELEKLPDKDISKRLNDFIKFAEALTEKDPRYFDGSGKLKNAGILWSAHYALLDAKLAARRNTRDFKQWDPGNKTAAVKDSLTGKEECIGDEDFWKDLAAQNEKIFTAASHRYGTMSLIKRLWCRIEAVDYLPQKLGLKAEVVKKALRADSTREIAERNDDGENHYIAVLAMDGDEMGKWVSGAKTPEFLKQLAPKAKYYLSSLAGQALRRLLTPSYHLQFSEALSNFAMHKAREIVEEHKGDLIYAGGDDVLAILPATYAITCAEKLRQAFRSDYDVNGRLFYPGSRCDVSCGIAVGHDNAPLQMLVREAQAAERRAKNDYDRAALAVSLYKRSGEIVHWGCKWDGSGNPLEIMRRLTDLTRTGKLSGRFPYALAALLQPYTLEEKNNRVPDIKEIIKREVDHALSRQGIGLSKNERNDLTGIINLYLDSLRDERLRDFINLFLAETFINRRRGEN
ncbi:MAG: type III-B CRISPR-associated protein Cas10/Cmr2, partial [Acidobacteria bacterium]|nr:type III-B CRISPR-associated protein Cas10/Cmr2 [Acidobacteriota bacterium]